MTLQRKTAPLPRVNDTLDTLSGAQWFSTLDLKSRYWQVGLHQEDKEKTAFSTPSAVSYTHLDVYKRQPTDCK